MFSRQIFQKEPLRKIVGGVVAFGFSYTTQKANLEAANNNGEASSSGPPVRTIPSFFANQFTPQVHDFFASTSTSTFKSSITNVAHCEPKVGLATASSKIGSFTYPANHPTEDRNTFGCHDQWTYGAVFDGHGGWQIADYASKHLVNKIFSQLQPVDFRDDNAVDVKIKVAFNEMEQTIVDNIRPAFQSGFGEVAKVGSCVLVALRRANKLVIANCGDCRAVMGSTPRIIYENTSIKKEEGINPKACFPTRINRDHNCRVPLEQANLIDKHPDEPNLIVCKNPQACYVKGRLQLTRSLGDAYLKYEEFNGNPAIGRSAGRYIPEPYTPPYVSHEPEIHHMLLEKEDQFLILGSDGLWDYLPDQEAVTIVFEGMKNHLDESKVAELLVNRALEIAAEESGMTLSELKQLPPGRNRRGRHDDTTAVVMFF